MLGMGKRGQKSRVGQEGKRRVLRTKRRPHAGGQLWEPGGALLLLYEFCDKEFEHCRNFNLEMGHSILPQNGFFSFFFFFGMDYLCSVSLFF